MIYNFSMKSKNEIRIEKGQYLNTFQILRIGDKMILELITASVVSICLCFVAYVVAVIFS